MLGQVAQNGAVIELTGDAPTVHFGELGGSNTLTLVHNSTDDELVCSGKIRASDVLIEGTSTTVAQMMTRLVLLEQEMAAMKQFVGMMPPPASPPALPPVIVDCEARALFICAGRVPCVDLVQSNQPHHHLMWLTPEGAFVDGEAYDFNDDRTWSCTCIGLCDGLVGTWSCPGFYSGTIPISSTYDSFDVSATQGPGSQVSIVRCGIPHQPPSPPQPQLPPSLPPVPMLLETHSNASWVLVLAYHMTSSEHAVCGSSYACQSPLHGWVVYNPHSLPTSREANSHLRLSAIGMTLNDIQSVRAYCRTNQHSRVINIRSTSMCAKEIVIDGTASSCSTNASDWKGSVVHEYENHTAKLPESATNSIPHSWATIAPQITTVAGAGQDALGSVFFWKGYGENWRPAFGECDNYHDGNVPSTHQVWYEVWAELSSSQGLHRSR